MAITPNFSYEDGYLVSKFNNKKVFLKFKQNRFTDSDNGYIRLSVYEDSEKLGTIAFNIDNSIYENMPSLYWVQQMTTFDDALSNIFFSLASSPNVSIVNNDRQLITYDEDNTDSVGATWHYDSTRDLQISLQEIILHFESSNITLEVDSNIPIFLDWTETPEGSYPDGNYTFRCEAYTHGDYDRQVSVYGATDILDKAENYYTSVTEIDTSETYYLTNYVYKNGALVQSVNYQFQFAKKGRNYVYSDGKNAEFRTTLSTFKVQRGSSPIFEIVDEIPDELLHLYDNCEWVDFNNGDNFVSHLYTNLKVVYNQDDETGYIGGWIPDDETPKHPSNIGEGLTSNTVNTTTCNYVGETIWLMSEEQVKELFDDVIYTPDDNVIDELKKGMWLWNSNPIECISSLYYVPFDVSLFYTTRQGAFKLGSYTPTTGSGEGSHFLREYISPNNNKITPIVLFNTMFTPIYNDFRDFTNVNYQLFLPFRGFVELNNSQYLNKMVKCEMIFDATTHEIRYFIYANGVITDRFDASVGVEMPLISSAKTEHLDSAKNLIGDTTQAIMSARGIGGGVGTMLSVTKGIDVAIDGFRTFASKPSISQEGSFSSGLNTYDIRYAYLKITINETIKPSNLNVRYNYPSYFIGSFSSLSGYCELADIRLNNFTGTLEELEDIKAKCKGGIIC